MINKIQIAILVMSLIDLSATYFYASSFQSKFPNLDYTVIEANPILRTSWRLFGLNKGMIFGGLLVFGLMTLVTLTASEKIQMFLLGVLSMMIIYHLLNFNQLRALNPSELT